MKLQSHSAGKRGLRAFGLALLTTGLTTTAFAQETAAVGRELIGYSAEARAALVPPVKHSAVCNGPQVAGTARCHAHIVMRVAAPLIAGIYGVNDLSVNFGSNPYNHTSALFDVTSGSNGSCSGSYLCTAKAGYDGPTGLGTPNGITAFGN